MDVEEVGGGRGDWMELAQDRDNSYGLHTVENKNDIYICRTPCSQRLEITTHRAT
jgi:hypothetical protein